MCGDVFRAAPPTTVFDRGVVLNFSRDVLSQPEQITAMFLS
jgi:hypothetical protein